MRCHHSSRAGQCVPHGWWAIPFREHSGSEAFQQIHCICQWDHLDLVLGYQWRKCGLVASQLITAFPEYFNGYVPERWHLFLIYQALNAFALIYNIALLKRTNWIHDAACEWSPVSAELSISGHI